MSRALSVIAFTFLILAEQCQGATILVMQDGSGDVTTISQGVLVAVSGDSLLIGPGMYEEQVLIEEDLTLLSRDGPDFTAIDAVGQPYCLRSVSDVSLLVQGLTLQGASSNQDPLSGNAIEGMGAVSIRSCVFTNGSSIDMHGLWWTGNARLEDCEASNIGTGGRATFLAIGGPFTVERSSFHDLSDFVLAASQGPLIVRECLFLDLLGVFPAVAGTTIENCIFRNLTGTAIGPYNPPVGLRSTQSLGAGMVISGCTFSKVQGETILASSSWPLALFERSLITGCNIAVDNTGPEDPEIFLCNDLWGNSINWLGMDDLTGINGNISSPPLYCDSVGGDLHVASNSPCLPQNNTCSVLIGALGEGCGLTSTDDESWGRIKARFR